MHYICICAILGEWRRNHLGPELDSALLAGFLRVALPRRKSVAPPCKAVPWRWLLAPNFGAHAKLALLMLRSIPLQGATPDRARRRTSGSLCGYPFCYESHARVRTLACGGRTATRSHGAAPAQECRLRLKRLPPKAVPWFPPFKSSTPERLSGLLPFRLLLPPWQTETRGSVLERKIALWELIFPPKQKSKRFLEGRGGPGRTRPNPACAR
jgi:hypothetical protein